MSMDQNLNKFLEELIQEVEKELDEMTGTGAVGGYNTPAAFSDGGRKDKKRKKKIATTLGYSVVGNDVGNIDEAMNVRDIPEYAFDGPDDFEDWYDGGMEIRGKKKLAPFSKSDERKLFGFVEDWIESRDDNRYGHGSSSDIDDQIKDIQKFLKQKGKVVKESVNEGAYTIMNVNHTISSTKKKLMKKWKQKGGYENFGQKELDILKKKLKYNPYGSQEERKIAKIIDNFDNWAMNYDGNMRESVNEAKVKRPVNRWLELKNDDSMHAHKKMAMGLKELKYQLRETEKFFNWYNKIKTMNELDSNQYWKRTNKHIYKIKERLVNIARTIQEIEK